MKFEFGALKKLIFIGFSAVLISACTSSKTYKLLRQGSVAQEKFYKTIPFEYRLEVPIIEAKVNGKKGWFLFDTGAPNVISREFADELKLEARLQNKVTDSAGNVSRDQDYVSIDSIDIAGVVFENTGAVVQNLKGSDIFKCLNIDGIIGANLMRQAYWSIDYQEETISFSSDLGDLNVDSTFMSLDFETRIQGTPLVKFELNGIPTTYMIFDTGSNQGLSFPTEYIKQLKDSMELYIVHELGSTSHGVGGMSDVDTVYHTIIDSIKISGVTFPKRQVFFDEHSDNFGNDFLENYKVILDWNEKKAYLKEVKKEEVLLESFGFGIFLENSQVKIGSIYAQAEKASQLVANDVILQFGEYNVAEMSLDDICELMLERAFRFEGRDEVTLKIQRGEEITELELERIQLLPKLD